MSDRTEDGLPQDLAEVGEVLRENRARPSALELDAIKLQARTRARGRSGSLGQLRRGVNVRSRGVTAVLALLLIGGTTARGIAGGGHDSGGGSSSDAQYQPPEWSKDMRKCSCPKGYPLAASGGQVVCEINSPPPPPPPPCDDHRGHGNNHCDNGHGGPGHGHHHHKHWRQHHDGHWQWCDNDRQGDNDWRDWNGNDDDW